MLRRDEQDEERRANWRRRVGESPTERKGYAGGHPARGVGFVLARPPPGQDAAPPHCEDHPGHRAGEGPEFGIHAAVSGASSHLHPAFRVFVCAASDWNRRLQVPISREICADAYPCGGTPSRGERCLENTACGGARPGVRAKASDAPAARSGSVAMSSAIPFVEPPPRNRR